MEMTHFRPADNNPLKFSANVDDALHNLLVKRNAAYLGPVDAFEDAFDDLRNHQLAMLAGMRVAFDSLLAEFDPDRLREGVRSAVEAEVPGWTRSHGRATGSSTANGGSRWPRTRTPASRACSARSSRGRTKSSSNDSRPRAASAPRSTGRSRPAAGPGLTIAARGCVTKRRFSSLLRRRMSIHNKVVWSEGLFLQPQHFQQQDRYFERYVETRCQALCRAQLGLHRDRDRTRLPEHRQVRPAPRRGRVPRRHAVPHAGRRSAAAADRHRRERARSDRVSRGAAPPVRRARGRSDGRGRRPGAPRDPGVSRRATPRRAPATARCSRWRALRTRLLLASRGHRRPTPCVPLAHVVECARRQAGRARRPLHPDGPARPRRDPPDDGLDRAARPASPARRGAERPRVGDRPRGGGGVRRLPDAAGDQPLRAAVRALRGIGRGPSRGAVPGVRVGGGRAGHVHDDVEAAADGSRPTATIGCASRSSRSSRRCARR